jgi:hypothetical protein
MPGDFDDSELTPKEKAFAEGVREGTVRTERRWERALQTQLAELQRTIRDKENAILHKS